MRKLLIGGLTLGISISTPSVNAQEMNAKVTLICSGKKLEFVRPLRDRMSAGTVYPVEILHGGSKVKGTFVGGNGEMVESNNKAFLYYGYRNPYLQIKRKQFPCKGNFYKSTDPRG